MTRNEFQAWVAKAGIYEEAYRLSSSADDNVYVLERSRGGWAVFFSERGNRNDEVWYPAEAQGLADLKARLERDITTRRASRSLAIGRWFAERGFQLSYEEAEGFTWADLQAASGLAFRRYGQGKDELAAAQRARERWVQEQGT